MFCICVYCKILIMQLSLFLLPQHFWFSWKRSFYNKKKRRKSCVQHIQEAYGNVWYIKDHLPCFIDWFQNTSVFRACFHMRAFTCLLPTSCCHWNKRCQILPPKAVIVHTRHAYYPETGIEFQAIAHLTRCYCKVSSTSMPS